MHYSLVVSILTLTTHNTSTSCDGGAIERGDVGETGWVRRRERTRYLIWLYTNGWCLTNLTLFTYYIKIQKLPCVESLESFDFWSDPSDLGQSVNIYLPVHTEEQISSLFYTSLKTFRSLKKTDKRERTFRQTHVIDIYLLFVYLI